MICTIKLLSSQTSSCPGSVTYSYVTLINLLNASVSSFVKWE